MDFKFFHLGYLHALWIVAALGGVVAYGLSRRQRALRLFATANLVEALTPEASLGRLWVKASLVLTALVLLTAAMIDPRWGVYYQDVRQRGIDVFVALDVSKSMLAEDVSPNRLERAKQYIRDILDAAGGDRIGLITFAGTTSLKCPLSIDYGAVRMMLDDIDVQSAPKGGTLIGDAIRTACESFTDEVKGYKAIVVFTDGEDHDSYPVEAAREAFDKLGARVYMVGLGDSNEGARIPVIVNGVRRFLEYEGQQVWSRMNPAALAEIALAGGGAAIPAGTARVDMGAQYRERIASRDQREFEQRQVERYHVRFAWFAAPALLLLFVEALMSERRVRAG